MQSLKAETDKLLNTIAKYENDAKEANERSDKADCDIRDLGKKCQSYEVEFDDTNDKLTKVLALLVEKEKSFKRAEAHLGSIR